MAVLQAEGANPNPNSNPSSNPNPSPSSNPSAVRLRTLLQAEGGPEETLRFGTLVWSAGLQQVHKRE